jgi:hypothetical protein
MVESLTLATAKSHGLLFKTGSPVSFTAIHNKEKAPNRGSRFQQDIEPAGYYTQVETSPNPELPKNIERVNVTLKNPLILYFNLSSENGYDKNSWKAQLSIHFRAKGKQLTRILLQHGYDGIITIDKKYNTTSEIVLLKPETIIKEDLKGQKANYVGTCAASFNNSGDCINDDLPYQNVSDFAKGEEDSIEVSKNEFLKNVDVPNELRKFLNQKDTLYLKDDENDVYMLYDSNKDVHYFFVR